MAFNIALTGIDTSQTYLDVTANNIANAASIGFKKSRGEFADIYSSGVYQNVNVSVGQGAKTAAVSQQFEQGSMQRTSSVLDLSIDGTGFFATSKQKDNYDFQYTRAGAFKLDSDSYMVNAFGDYLRAFPVDENGKTTTISMAATDAVQVPTSLGEPEETENIDFTVNFPVETDPKEAKDLSKFDPTDSTSYNYSTASIFYDSVGTRHTLNVYYIKPGREMMLASGESGMVDLSVVYDPKGPMDYKTAWAAFYEINGTPIQPLNADKNDVEGFAYEARNLTTPEYPNGRALDPNFSNLTDPPIATSISVNNTKIGEGKIYPGKVASETPDDIIPDNATTAVDKQDLHIVNGDKTNEDRPKDFWRCEFLFMGRGETDFFEPTDPVILQPLGFVDDKIGETKSALGTPIPLEPVKIEDTKIIFDSAAFEPARPGEIGNLTITLGIPTGGQITNADDNSLFNPYRIQVPIDESIKTTKDYAKAVQNALNTVMAKTVNAQSDLSPTATPANSVVPAEYNNITVRAALQMDGYTIEVDPITAELLVQQNQTEQAKNGGKTGDFQGVTFDYAITDVGTPIFEEPTIIKYTSDPTKFTPSDAIGSTTNMKMSNLNMVFTLADGSTKTIQLRIQPTDPNGISPQTNAAFVAAIVNTFNASKGPELTDMEMKVDPENENNFILESNHTTNVALNLSAAQAGGTGMTAPPTLAYEIKDGGGKSFVVTAGKSAAAVDMTPIVAAADSGTEFSIYLQNEEDSTQSIEVPTGETDPIVGENNDPGNVLTTGGNPATWSETFTVDSLIPFDGASATAGVDANANLNLTLTPKVGIPLSIDIDINPTAVNTEILLAQAIGNALTAAKPNTVDFYSVTPAAGTTITFMGSENFELVEGTGIQWTYTPPQIDKDLDIPGGDANLSFTISGRDAVSNFVGKIEATAVATVSPTVPSGVLLGSGLQAASPVTYSATAGYPLSVPVGGSFTAGASPQSVIALPDPNSLGVDILYGAASPDQELTIRYVDNTMYDTDFQVLDINVDGAAVGRLTSVDIGTDGLIQASFTNGKTEPIGRVALARFNNEQGLLKVGNTSWVQSVASGDAIAGQARSGTYGDINSATLEQSNVDLSTQLVDLIIAQRNYQANARSLEVDSTIQQTILQIR